MPAPSPCTLVIFGASGDLAKLKLLPAIYKLAEEKLLPSEFALIGYSRTEISDDAFRDRFREAVRKQHEDADDSIVENLAGKLYYQPGPYDEAAGFETLKDRLKEVGDRHGTGGNALFYLSTPPSTFAPVVDCLGDVGLISKEQGGPWTRVVIEKPFGYDLKSAKTLNAQLHEQLWEDQIYRIDHYLGKELVQNMMVLRFANSIFEPLWSSRYVDHVQITVAESVSADDRAGYYDKSGALRDMVQNHMLQLMALTAMEPPAGLDAKHTRDEKVKVFQSIRKLRPEHVKKFAVRGQYGAGDDTPGYARAKGVEEDTKTETFAAVKLYVDNWRWSGTPFYLRTGKCLPRKLSEIAVRFKAPPMTLFQTQCESPVFPNDLIIRVAPNTGIDLRVNGKVPGNTLNIKNVAFDFDYGETFQKEPPEAYERLIADAMAGDQSLFIRGDEAEAAWEVVDPILDGWQQQNADGNRPEPYDPGSWGPDAAQQLISRDGRQWLQSGDEPAPVIACSV